MAEDTTNPFAAILGQLKSKSKSTRTGVRADEPADKVKVKSTLETAEVSRYKKIFDIMKDILNPGPEAARLGTTKAASVGKVGEMQQSKVEVAESKNSNSWLKALLYGLAIAAAAWVSQFIDDFQQWGLKMLLKASVWFKPLTKVIKAVITGVKTRFWNFIKGLKPVMKIVDRITDWFKGFSTAIKGSKTFGTIMKAGGSIMKVLKTAGKAAGKILMKMGRFLPVVGSIFSFGFAIAKYLKGDLLGGTLELISGIVNLIPGGQLVSMLLDGYILYRDFSMAKKEKGEDPDSGEPGMLSKIWTSISGWFSKNYKRLPIIGGIVKIGEAAGHLLKGQWLPGFRALFQVVPTWIGGGTAGDFAGKGFDFVMGLFDSDDTEDSSDSGDPGMLSKIWTSIKGWVGENYKKLPIIAGIVKMGEAARYLSNGEWLSGLKSLYQIIPSWIGGSAGGDAIGWGFDFVLGLFDSEGVDYDGVDTDAVSAGSSFSDMISSMYSRIGDILSNIWGGIKNKVKKWKDKALSWIPGLGGGGDDEMPEFSEDQPEATSPSRRGNYTGSNRMIIDGYIAKGGKKTRFGSQDDILTANSGGSVDKLLNANSAVMTELNDVNKNQLQVLESIRNGINTLVAQGSGSGGSSTETGTEFINNPLTQQFYTDAV